MKSNPGLLATCAMLLLRLTAVPGAYAAVKGPEATIREFIRASYFNDSVAFDRVTLPAPESHLLLNREKIPAKERKEILQELKTSHLQRLLPFRLRGVDLDTTRSGDYPVGTMTRYLSDFRGSPTVVTVVRQSDGWKIDPRWWMAMIHEMREGGPGEGTPEYAIKQLLATMLAINQKAAEQFVTPGADMSLLFQGAPSQPEPSDQLGALVEEMPLVTIPPGEFYQFPAGDVAEGSPSPDQSRLIVGLMGSVEIPFLVRKIDSGWRVTPQPYYYYLNQ
jgi:hypothetical protein